MADVEKLVRLTKRIVKAMIYRPGSIDYGAESYVLRPCTIHGGSNITLGEKSVIHDHGYLSAIRNYAGVCYAPQITIGRNVYIGRYVYLTALQKIAIGDGCVLSEQVYITDLMHGIDPSCGPIMDQLLESKGPVIIGQNCFLGYRTSIMPGVSLGNNCVVGAHALVTKSFPAHSMIAGSPAKLIKSFDLSQKRWVAANG